MNDLKIKPGTAIVTGANGQDGYFLVEQLLADGWVVYATARQADRLEFPHLTDEVRARLEILEADLRQPQPIFDLITRLQPDEFYNLAGQSSVSRSFSEPLYTWRTNAEAVVHLLECLRKNSRHTRFYQASSTDMFGLSPSGIMLYDEASALNPQSPYASAKAAAHLLCHSYREVYGLRIASGILSNHESHRRPATFLSRKVVEHVLNLKRLPSDEAALLPPLAMGNLKVQRDWGFAPDYVDGMCRILRQIETRAAVTGIEKESDKGTNYRDYVLATGETHAVWEMVDSAFTIAGLELEWDLEGKDPAAWRGFFRSNGRPAIRVNPDLLRAAEPLVIEVDPRRAHNELGWLPKRGLEVFLTDMLDKLSPLFLIR